MYTLKHEVVWPTTNKLYVTQAKFVDLCSLLTVVGAIDGMYVVIMKPNFSPVDYFYFKSGRYRMNY